MNYIVTFDDGTSAYLEHHGTKGMKWGVHNEETKIKYGELRKGDRNSAFERGENYSRKQGKAFVKREKLTNKAAKAKEAGNLKKYSKLSNKAEKANYKYEREREFKNWGKSNLSDGQRTRAAVGQFAKSYVKGNTGLGVMAAAPTLAALAVASPAVGVAASAGALAVGGILVGSGVKNAYRGVRTVTSKKPTVNVNVTSRG